MAPAAGSVFTTTNPDEAHAFMREAYVENTMRIRGGRDRFRMAHSFREAGPLTLSTLTHSMAVEHRALPLGRLILARVLEGRIERDTGGESVRAGRDDVFLVAPPDRPYIVRWDDVVLQLVSIEDSAIADLGGTTRFTSHQPVSTAAARLCVSAIDFLTDEVLPNPAAGPLVLDNAARTLCAAVLAAFPSAGDGQGHDASPAALRRAVDHIAAHAHRPVGLTEIARAAHVTPRTLQLLFRRHLDTTPTEHLRAVRLARAHRDLAAAGPHETVTSVATRWGFHHQGRFAALYHRTYGRTPRQTLRGQPSLP
ncbi:AraC family transcriptional regulator [Actinokineospora sp. 24-640]